MTSMTGRSLSAAGAWVISGTAGADSLSAFSEGSGLAINAIHTAMGVAVFALLVVCTALAAVSMIRPWKQGDIDALSMFTTLGVAVALLATGGFLASYFLI